MATLSELDDQFDGTPLGTMLESLVKSKTSWTSVETVFVASEVETLIEIIYSCSDTLDRFREAVTYFTTLTVSLEAEHLTLPFTCGPHRGKLSGNDADKNEHLWSSVPPPHPSPLEHDQGQLVFVVLNPPNPHDAESAESFAKLCDSDTFHVTTNFIGWVFRNQNGNLFESSLESHSGACIKVGDTVDVYRISFDDFETLNEFYTCDL